MIDTLAEIWSSKGTKAVWNKELCEQQALQSCFPVSLTPPGSAYLDHVFLLRAALGWAPHLTADLAEACL